MDGCQSESNRTLVGQCWAVSEVSSTGVPQTTGPAKTKAAPAPTGDRVDALGGTISLASPSSGTTLVELPMTPE
jgi:hypothetical protein